MAVKMEALYGVMHGGTVEYLWGNTENYDILPSIELQTHLEQLPTGTKVGVETWDPDEFDTKKLEFGPGVSVTGIGGERYWNEVLGICNQVGLVPVFLDDFLTWKAAMTYKYKADYKRRSAYQAEELIYRYEEGLTAGEFELEDLLKSRRATLEEAYRDSATFNYLFEVQREEIIWQNLVKHQPRMAIVGRAHGDYLMQSPKTQQEFGIEAKSYKQEGVDSERVLRMARNGYLGPHFGKVQPVIAFDQYILADRESRIRAFRVAESGRVMDPRQFTPDFIGSWNTQCRPEGLFEIYLDGQERSGRKTGLCQDTLGIADIEVVQDDGVVFDFFKSYRLNQAVENVVEGSMHYRGVKVNQVYLGEFEVRGGKGSFIMNQGSNLLD